MDGAEGSIGDAAPAQGTDDAPPAADTGEPVAEEPADGGAGAADEAPGAPEDGSGTAAGEAGTVDEGGARELAGRAAALADGSTDRPEPAPLQERPGTTTVERDVPEPAPGGTDELARIAAAWDAIIEAVGEQSRRAKAFYEPAAPTRLNNGVLLLSYPADKRFHAEQAKSGEMTGHLAASIEQATGLERIRVDVQLDDEGPRRPTPPPAAGGSSDDGPSPAEVAAVNEVERTSAPTEVDPTEVEDLLVTELGAQRLDDD